MSGLSTSNLHSHKCLRCETVWRHDPKTIPEGKNVEAHTCPKCEIVVYRKHREQRFGEAVPASFCNNGERTITVPADDAIGLVETPKPERLYSMPDWLR